MPLFFFMLGFASRHSVRCDARIEEQMLLLVCLQSPVAPKPSQYALRHRFADNDQSRRRWCAEKLRDACFQRIHFSLPNVPMCRAYGWRGSCSAGAVTDVGVGPGGWLGAFRLKCSRLQ